MKKSIIIFDMDGVLVDTEPIYYQLNQDQFANLGIEVSREEYNSFVGVPSREIWEFLNERYALKLDIENWLEEEKELLHQKLREAELAPMPGVSLLLNELRERDVPMSVASSSLKKSIDIILEKLQFTNHFVHKVSGEEVKNGKPAPDIFLKTAGLHQTAPDRCLVIEDSHNGVKAAKTADMGCIGFRSPNSGQQDLSQADMIIEDFDQSARETVLKIMS